MEPWIRILVGYAFAGLLGEVLTALVVGYLWSRVPTSSDPDLRAPSAVIRHSHGAAEKCLYATCVFLGRPDGIAVWLGFKAIMRITVNDRDSRHVSGSLIYMTGTMLSLAFGVAGGMLAKGEFRV